MIHLSAYIVTLNEQERLGRTLEALCQVADEIIIVDSGSTDKTEEIAQKYGARFMFHPWKNISAQKHFAQEQCQNEWVLSLDADEVLSPALMEEIKKIKENPEADAYRMRIGDMFPGFKKPRKWTRKYNLVRLYNRHKATMPDDLTHDRVVRFDGCRVEQLKNEIYHYSYLSLSQTWYKYNMYTDELVKTALATGKNYSKIRLITEFPYQFFRYYFVRRYIFNGTWGLVMAMTLAYFRFLKISKFFEYKMLSAEKSLPPSNDEAL